jgi:hypothetical protein
MFFQETFEKEWPPYTPGPDKERKVSVASIVQACHKDAGLGACYDFGRKVLRLRCMKCHQDIAIVAVASAMDAENKQD